MSSSRPQCDAERTGPSGASPAVLPTSILGGPLEAALTDGLRRVEDLLHAELHSGADFMVDKVSHLANAGGKRFRPMFALLASHYGVEPCCDDVVKAACIVEMTHLATLYHDDVMDEAKIRRGVISANARWDNSVAILAGDFLLARASRIMAELGVDTVTHFSETFGELVTGQMRETVGAQGGDPIAHYCAVIREKTAVLIASAGYLGAFHSGADPEIVERLRRIGSAMGMMFQIVDDVIDLYSDPEQSGKNPGTDLKEGVRTLPILYAMRGDDPASVELRELLATPPQDDAAVARALELIRASDGKERSLADVRSYLDAAHAELAELPAIPATEALGQVLDYTVRRVG